MSHRTCDYEGCGERHYAKGWCRLHYGRWKKRGSPEPYRRPLKLEGVTVRCSTCETVKDRGAFAKGQYICRECRRKYNDNNYRLGRTCVDCSVRILDKNKYDYCRSCNAKNRRGISIGAGRHVNAYGYVVLSGQWDHPNAWKGNGCLLEHVKVMSETLGRALLPDENVHHINGVRDDNRPENLELWSRSQPSGQRVADKVAWAQEILATYAPHVLQDPTHTRTYR